MQPINKNNRRKKKGCTDWPFNDKRFLPTALQSLHSFNKIKLEKEWLKYEKKNLPCLLLPFFANFKGLKDKERMDIKQKLEKICDE